MLRFATLLAITLITTAQAGTIVEESDSDDTFVVRIKATPADAPSPLLKYRFDLQPSKRTHGNAAADYRRSFAESVLRRAWERANTQFPSHTDEGGEAGAEDWYSNGIPLDQLPADKVAVAAREFDGIVENCVRPGTSRRRCEWDLPTLDLKGPDLVALWLSDFQELRSLSRALSLQARHALVEKDFDRAVDLVRMNLTLGRDAAREPLLICSLIGIAISGMATSNIQDMIGVEGSPNVYWALSSLDAPRIPVRPAIAVEMEFGKRVLPVIDDLPAEPLTYDGWNARWKQGSQFLNDNQLFSDQRRPVGFEFLPLAFGLNSYSHAKKRLIAWGYPADEVEAMAVGQVLSTYSSRAYQNLADEVEVSYYLPYQESLAWNNEFEQRLQKASPWSDGVDREVLPVATLFLPAISTARSAEVRLDREIAALRIIEALRMHAAQNDAALPKRLTDVTCVPIPLNPATNAAFQYELKEIEGKSTAVLTLPSSDGIRRSGRYELVIQRN